MPAARVSPSTTSRSAGGSSATRRSASGAEPTFSARTVTVARSPGFGAAGATVRSTTSGAVGGPASETYPA
ncbi:hypothetical protein ACFQL4_15355 [Halosimplex aquaticum]